MIWDKVCGICKKHFEANSLNTKYCGLVCRNKALREQQNKHRKMWVQKNREKYNKYQKGYQKERTKRFNQLHRENQELKKKIEKLRQGGL